MHSRTCAAAHVGRIGALAVALGVGAAVATGTGIAAAETGTAGSGAKSSEQSPNSSPATPAARPEKPTARSGKGSPRRAGTASSSGGANKTRGHLAPDTADPKDAVSEPAAARVVVKSQPLAATPPPSVEVARAVSTPPDPAASTVTLPVATAASQSAVQPTLAPQPVAVFQSLAATPAKTPRLLSRLLSAVGLAPLASTRGPLTPAQSPALWVLVAAARREFANAMGQSARPAAAFSASAAQPTVVATAAVTPTQPTSLPSTPVGWVTGVNNSGFPGWNWAQTNDTSWANVYGTDLGIMWFNGDNGKVQLAFGDTFSGPNMTGDWRSNVLLLSLDRNLSDGLALEPTGPAFQFIPAAPDAVFFIGSEVTNIPTSAVYANGENYVNYMSVKSWDTPGRWTTNYSAISMFDPATDKWVLQRSTIRSAGWFRSSTPYVAGNQNFQQAAYVLQPADKVAPGETRYLYAFGTPAGRAGSAYLSRVPEGAVTDLSQYEYWDGNTWVRNKPAVAAPVIGDSTRSTGLFGPIIDLANDPDFCGGWFAGFTGAKTGGNVSEMSVQYNEYLDKYVVMYADGNNNIQMRTADTPEGTWSEPITVARSIDYPGLYAPMIHPLSGTGDLTYVNANGQTVQDVSNLYWNMSLWGNYNVVLMKTDLTPLHTVTM